MRLLSKHNYTTLLRTALLFGVMVACQSLLLTGCSSSDDVDGPGQNPSQGDKVKVTFRIAPAGTKVQTRATDWQDPNVNTGGLDEEMMNIWTVVMVNDNGNKVERIFVGKPTYTPSEQVDDNREIDFVVKNLELTSGDKYHIYSFANIAPTQVFSLLGMSVTGYADPDEPNGVATFETSAIKAVDATGGPATTGATLIPKPASGGNDRYVDDIEVSLGANGKTYADLTATDDPFGFGSKGIPMSNVQTYTVPSTNDTKDLIVIRMFAKIEFQIFNQSETTDLRLKSITITDVTKNPEASESTLKLLPVLTGHDTMEATHSDLFNDIANMPIVTTADYKYKLATPLAISKNTKYTDELSTPAQTIAFYINESKAPTGGDKLFHIAVELMDADNVSTSESRFAVITKSDNATGNTGDWDYIARNDYRIIPIVLDDVRYRLELIPYDFPEIGVYPSSAKLLNESNNLWQIDFHDYGHFHLVPRVVKIAASTTTEIPFSATKATLSGNTYTATTWSLIDENGVADAADWTASWKSWTDENKTTEYSATNAATVGLYGQRDGAGAAVYASLTDYAYPTAADASENGNFPVLDTKTKWNGYNAASPSTNPYIFGQIAPHDKDAKASCYHEFSVRVYPEGKPLPYELIYRVIVNYQQDHATARKASTRCCNHN